MEGDSLEGQTGSSSESETVQMLTAIMRHSLTFKMIYVTMGTGWSDDMLPWELDGQMICYHGNWMIR